MLAFLISAALLSGPADTVEYRRPDELVRAMHARHAPHWIRSMTFVQKTTFPDRPSETWYEAALMPGMLRIDVAPLDSGRAMVFRNDSLYVFRNGALTRSLPYVHPLMVLGSDIYALPPARTLEKLKSLGFDLSKLAKGTWNDRPAYIVGAAAGDTTSPQFWVDRERLQVVRILQPSPQKPSDITDFRYTAFMPVGKTWVETEMAFVRGGKEFQREIYQDVRVNVPIDSALFAVDRYRRPAWVSDTDQALRRAFQTAENTWNAADLAGHVAMYADSATFMTGRGPLTGKGRIEDVLRRSFWVDGKPTQQLEFRDLVVRPLGNDNALVTGQFILSGGGKPNATGRFSTVWQRTAAGWRMIHDHSG